MCGAIDYALVKRAGDAVHFQNTVSQQQKQTSTRGCKREMERKSGRATAGKMRCASANIADGTEGRRGNEQCAGENARPL